MAYFNYHAKIKNLIKDKKVIKFEIVEKWNNISPALLIYCDDGNVYPVREYKWSEYENLLKEI